MGDYYNSWRGGGGQIIKKLYCLACIYQTSERGRRVSKFIYRRKKLTPHKITVTGW